jgi:hypothetical protein
MTFLLFCDLSRLLLHTSSFPYPKAGPSLVCASAVSLSYSFATTFTGDSGCLAWEVDGCKRERETIEPLDFGAKQTHNKTEFREPTKEVIATWSDVVDLRSDRLLDSAFFQNEQSVDR